jgi:hypothetical protein
MISTMQHEQEQEGGLIYLVAIDTRGLPASDLQEGFEELKCSRDYFITHILHSFKTRCVTCSLAESCGLSKHVKIYFQQYLAGEGSARSDPDKELAWSEYFPLEQNNPGATLLTMDHSTGFARYNVQGIAYVLYDEGRYPVSKEQVWGLCEMANEAKDIYFCNKTNREGQIMLSRWCKQYRKGHWGPSSIYQPRDLEHKRKCNSGQLACYTNFGETCLI